MQQTLVISRLGWPRGVPAASGRATDPSRSATCGCRQINEPMFVMARSPGRGRWKLVTSRVRRSVRCQGVHAGAHQRRGGLGPDLHASLVDNEHRSPGADWLSRLAAEPHCSSRRRRPLSELSTGYGQRGSFVQRDAVRCLCVQASALSSELEPAGTAGTALAAGNKLSR